MYTTGIAWREDKVGELSGSWNDLALDAAKGRTFMLDDCQEGIGQANLSGPFLEVKVLRDQLTHWHGRCLRVRIRLRRRSRLEPYPHPEP